MPTISAAVLRETGGPLRLEALEQSAPGPRDVLVRTGAAGLCHTDLEVIRGSIAMPLPMVLGHELAGTVEAIGAAVTSVAVGDHVIASWNPACGRCFHCSRGQPLLCSVCGLAAAAGSLPDGRWPLSDAEGPVRQFMFMGGHATHAVIPEAAAVPVAPALPFPIGAIIGCGVATGVIPALRSDVLDPVATALVVGCGIVGLSAILGARLAGTGTVVAVDRDPARLALAARLGADVTVDVGVVDVGVEDALARVRAVTGGRGADHVFEAAGNGAAMRLAFEATRVGGELTLLGKLANDDDLALRWGSVAGNKTIRRLAYGGARPDRDFPLLADLYLAGRLDLDPLVDRQLPLADIDAGFAAVARGEVLRAVAIP